MTSAEILFAKKCLKSLPTLHDKTKTDTRERRRNVLYLIHSYLNEQKLFDSVETLEKEAKLSTDYQVCENVDLEIILQDYQSYYYTKFQKYPKIVKKNEDLSGNINKTKRKTSATKKSITQTDNKETNKSESCNFQFEIKTLNNELIKEDNTQLKEEEYIDTYDLEDIPDDMKGMVDQIRREFITTNSETTWEDCVGLSDVVEKLKEAIVYPLLYPALFKNVATWKGVLLFGPPGTGKTLLAKALASEGSTFINVTSSAFISKWRGDSEKMLRLLFQIARKYSPTTIFIDEVDALASQLSHHEASRRFKGELLTQIDGIHNSTSNVFVLGSTNSPWNLDMALLRRFEKRLLVPLPNEKSRLELLKKYLGQPVDIEQKELQQLTKLTENFSGSDIKTLCKEVNMSIIREKINEINTKGSNKTQLSLRIMTLTDVQKALEKVKPCIKDTDCVKYFEWNKQHGSW